MGMPIKLRSWQWVVLALVAIAALDWFIKLPDDRSRSLTNAIRENGSVAVKNYPYQFHVMRVEGGTAVVGTPRNFDVPAARMIAVLYPKINTKDSNDPAFIAAQQELGAVQSEVRGIVMRQPGINDVRWELDRDWLVSHYIEVPDMQR